MPRRVFKDESNTEQEMYLLFVEAKGNLWVLDDAMGDWLRRLFPVLPGISP
jgi:hypothetical protein